MGTRKGCCRRCLFGDSRRCSAKKPRRRDRDRACRDGEALEEPEDPEDPKDPEDPEDPEEPEDGCDRKLSDVQHSLLTNANRKRIVDQLSRTPGLNKNLLRKRVGIHRTSLDFHIDRLKRAKLVVTRSGVKGHQRICFLRFDAHLWDNVRTRVLFGREPTRQIALYIAENPGASVAEIAEAMDRSPSITRLHLETLQDARLIDRIKQGAEYGHFAEPTLDAWVAEVGSGYRRAWEQAEECGSAGGQGLAGGAPGGLDQLDQENIVGLKDWVRENLP